MVEDSLPAKRSTATVPAVFAGGRPERVVALVGNPNVGKSTLFNHLTGLGVVTAHYPGKSLEVNVGQTEVDSVTVSVVDIPGTYSLSTSSEESWVARQTLRDVDPDCVIVVVDATNLARTLVLALQVIDLGRPTVVAVNLTDEAGRQGKTVDSKALAAALGVPVVATVAVDGTGVAEVLRTAVSHGVGEPRACREPCYRYGSGFESLLKPLTEAFRESIGARQEDMVPRVVALEALQSADRGDWPYPGPYGAAFDEAVSLSVDNARRTRGEHIGTTISRERHGLALRLTESVLDSQAPRQDRLTRFRTLATSPLTGIPILIAVLSSIFLFLFFVGDALASAFSALWRTFASPVIQDVVHGLVGQGRVGRTLLWGLDAGIEASLSIGLPYILTFYVLLSLLEDSGYLNAVAFLTDRLMHHFGLHGRAVIPMVSGAGCSVPAVLATRVLGTERERMIACTLISMVPCSARTAVIMGAVGHYIGFGAALGVFVVSALVTGVAGALLDRLLPGSGAGMVMEMFPFRRPSLRIVWRKAWSQFREFLVIATPLVVVGSVVLGGLYEWDLLWRIAAPFDPLVVGLLGLPSIAGLTLLFGLLRKEFALQLLVTLGIATMGERAGDLTFFMSSTDLFVYALVNTLAVPCVSTVAVLGRTLGWRRSGVVMSITVTIALLMGALFSRLLPLIGSVLS